MYLRDIVWLKGLLIIYIIFRLYPSVTNRPHLGILNNLLIATYLFYLCLFNIVCVWSSFSSLLATFMWHGKSNQYSRQLGMIKLSAGYKEVSPTSSHKENSSSLLNQLANLPGFNPLKARIVKQYAKTPEEILPTAVEKSLPWRRDRSTYNFGMCLLESWNVFKCH